MKNTNNKIIMLLLIILFSSIQLWALQVENTPESNFELFWNEYRLCYALFEEKGIDWNQVYREYRPLVTPDITEQELFDIFKEMQGLLVDTHIQLASPFDYYRSGHGYSREPNFSLNVVKNNYLQNSKSAGTGFFTYGFLSPETGYIYISTMNSSETTVDSHEKWVEDINLILDEFRDTSGIIIDVRNNGGGLPSTVKYIAARFADKKRVYSKVYTKSGPDPDDFSGPVENSFEPEGSVYRKPVVLITDNNTASAAEYFTLAMKTIPTVVHTGSPTMGILSLSLIRELPNGWIYTVSVQKVINGNNVSPEGVGISPLPANLVYNTVEEKNQGIDRQLEAALNLIRRQ